MTRFTARVLSLVRSQSDAGVAHSLHGRAAIAAVHVVPAAAVQHAEAAGCCSCGMSKSDPCFKRTGMIECHHVLIGHVTGSLQKGRVFHEVITFTTVGHSC